MCIPGLFGGGGGGGSLPDNSANAPGVQEAINAKRDAEAERQQRIQLYADRRTELMGRLPNIVRNYAASIGVDPSQVPDAINQVINDMAAAIPAAGQDTTVDPNSYVTTPNLVNVMNAQTTRMRGLAGNAVTNAFGPNYASKLLPDTMIDDIVNQIYGEQRGLAQKSVDYQTKRGLLTPAGTEQATKSLEGQGAAARSTLSGLAQNVLSKDRATINDIISRAGTAASGWNFGDKPFTVDPYAAEATSAAGRESSGFGGDVRAALGKTQLFDIPTLVAQAGQAQGAQNLTTGTSAPVPGARKKTGPDRGLGSAGGGF